MAELRDDDYQEMIERLERSNHWWRGMAVGLLVVLAAAAGIGLMQFTRAEQARLEALAQQEQAREAEMRARQQAEEAARNVQQFLKKELP
jgi:uncharacterized iron-regulated membrane protein